MFGLKINFFVAFLRGHKIYLSTGPNYDFIKFRQLVHEVTQEFKRISVEIIAIEKELRFYGFSNLADLIIQLQEEEKIKLEVSAQLQLAKQEANDNPDHQGKLNEIIQLKERYICRSSKTFYNLFDYM